MVQIGKDKLKNLDGFVSVSPSIVERFRIKNGLSYKGVLDGSEKTKADGSFLFDTDKVFSFEAVADGFAGNGITINFTELEASQTLGVVLDGDVITITYETDVDSVVLTTATELETAFNAVVGMDEVCIADKGLGTDEVVENFDSIILSGGSDSQPVLVDGVGDAGDFYIVGEAGTCNFGSGDIVLVEGEFVLYSGTVWQKSEPFNNVISVNTKTGDIVLGASDVGAEPFLGTPDAEGKVLASSVAGARTFVDKENPLTFSTGLTRTTNTVTVNDSEIDHNSLDNYDVEEHRKIDDLADGLTDLWSASKIKGEIEGIVVSHEDLTNTDAEDCHPIESITGLQAAIDNVRPIKTIDYEFLEPYEGVISSCGTEFLADDTAEWTVDEHKGKVVCIKLNGSTLCVICESNTDTVINFDEEVVETISAGMEFKILDTINLTKTDVSVVVAGDTTNYSGGVVLPKVEEDIVRRNIIIYIEKGENPLEIVCTEGDRLRGVKYAVLESAYESVLLSPHMYLTNHFDVFNTYNIKRYAVAKTDDDVELASETYVPINDHFQFLKGRRFVNHEISGQNFLESTSVITSDYEFTGSLKIEKSTGGAGELTATIRVIKANDDVVDYEDFEVTTRFASGSGAQNLIVTVPVTLSKGDKIGLIAKRTSGTFEVVSGSLISIKEY